MSSINTWIIDNLNEHKSKRLSVQMILELMCDMPDEIFLVWLKTASPKISLPQTPVKHGQEYTHD